MHIDFDDWNPVDYVAVLGGVIAVLGLVAVLVTEQPPQVPPARWSVRMTLGGLIFGGVALVGDVIARKINLDDWVGFGAVLVVLALLVGWAALVRQVTRREEAGKDESAARWARGLEAQRAAEEGKRDKLGKDTERESDG